MTEERRDMATVIQICSFFVAKGIEEAREITQISLQKLLYFAQGISLATYGKRLFDEEIYAWKYGPVVKPVYYQFKMFGADAMDKEMVSILLGEDFLKEKDQLSATEKNITQFVWDQLGKLDPFDLVAMTHVENSPWSQEIKLHGTDKRDVVISDESMKKYFKTILVQKQS